MSKRIVLPTNVKPVHYDLELKTCFKTFQFQGKVGISVQVLDVCDTLVMNSRELSIKSCQVIGSDIKCVCIDVKEQTVEFKFDQVLLVGTVGLEIEFQGHNNDSMVGFYRSKYKHGEEDKYMLVTQFEAVDCRRCFPCFDEPALKATFSITIICDADLTCLSNMGILEEHIEDGGMKRVKFEKTPIMSTYLVAFAVGDFEYLEMLSTPCLGPPVKIKTYTLPGQKHLAQFATECAVKVLEFFTEYYQVEYKLQKLDMIAVPDFAAGAMENWGLVTYREEALLFDPDNSSLFVKEDVCYTVAHELAHQWFGNLVTMVLILI